MSFLAIKHLLDFSFAEPVAYFQLCFIQGEHLTIVGSTTRTCNWWLAQNSRGYVVISFTTGKY